MDTIHKLNEFWSSQLHNLVKHTVQVQISNHSSKRHWNSKSTIRDSWKLPIERPWRICLDLNLKETVENMRLILPFQNHLKIAVSNVQFACCVL
jgi:hypothetical protein